MPVQSKSRRTQAERTQASDKAIYKAAIKLIAEEGPKNMSLARLGKVAGFSGGLISYRFGTKSNMLKAVENDLIMALFRLMNDSYSTHKELKSQFSEYDNKARSIIINLLEKGIASGEIKTSIDPRGVAVFYIAILRGAALQYFIDEKNVDLKQIDRMVSNMLLELKA